MHKHLSDWVVAATIIFLIASLGIAKVSADTPSVWLSSSLSISKQADTASLPTTVSGSGNVDCTIEDGSNCIVPTNYGAASPASTIRLNSSEKFIPVTTYIDGRQHYYPVPNSDVALSIYNGPVYGLNVAFNYSFMSSVIKSGDSYKMNRAPDAYLADKAKHKLAADGLSISFSENGRWMIVSSPNLAVLRINLETFEVLPFAPGFNYTIGLDPAVKTAISDDGRYAVVASKNFLTFKLYDLSTCAAVPDIVSGSVACQSRDLRGPMLAASYDDSVNNIRFMDEQSLAVYDFYTAGSSKKMARFTISTDNSTSLFQYLALGDSYIVGEGAFDYQGGTDTSSNKCHLSYLAYPYLIGRDLNYDSYHSVACSGATTDDITDTRGDYTGQNTEKIKRSDRPQADIDSIVAAFTPGYINQLDFVKTYQPKIINLSVGGNDMGFAQILRTCVEPKLNNTCYSTYEDRLELVRQINTSVLPKLIQTYQKIKAAGPPDMRIYIIGYPQIAKPGGDCGLNVHLNSDEVLFSQELIDYLDQVVQTAAARTGVYYVDTQDALDGHRLCEAGPGEIAVNGLTAGNDRPNVFGGPIGDESYHPNSTGYRLLENKILSATHNLTDPMPATDWIATVPPESGLVILNTPKSGRPVNTTEFDNNIAADLAYRGSAVNVSINGSLHGLPPAASLKAELHSAPINLGTFSTGSDGNLEAEVVIPASVLTGYHSLHFYGTDLAGQPIDIYKGIYVASTASDLDGDGNLDTTQKCVGVESSGEDADKDGIDDSCDANITQPPVTESVEVDEITLTAPENSGNQSNSQSGIGLVLAPAPAADSIASGINTNDEILSSAGKPHSPSVLGETTSESAAPSSINQLSDDNANGKYVFAGGLIMLIGVLGLLYKRWIF